MNDIVLDLQNISKSYNTGKPNEVRVLNAFDLAINAGEIVALVAPSGTGKTTLLNIAGLLDTADAGSVSIDGQEMTAASDNERTAIRGRKVGFVYQFHHLLPEFSALENVMMPQLGIGRDRETAKKRAQDLLDRIGLGERRTHRPAALSGGEAQRAAIARGLANNPRLLLADEPTGNLDPDNSDRVFDILIEMARAEGMGALVATHNLELAAKMDRRIDLTALV